MGSLPAQAAFEFLEPANLAKVIKKEVAKQSIGANVNLVNGEIFDGISASLKYRIQSEPSYVNGYYTRLDRYIFGVDIQPGDLIDGLDLPVGFGINKNAEVIFARQFKSQTESLTALPYGLKQLPLSARTARNELNVGDFVSLQSRLSFVVSLGASSPLGPVLTASGSTHAYISGDFLIHLFKMADDKMRVKLIAIRGSGSGVGAQVSVGSGFKIIGFNYVDKRIKKWIDLTPLAMDAKQTKSDLFMVDYVFDLKNPKVAEAYEELLTRKTRFKDLAMVSPVASAKDLKEELLTDLSTVEQISYEDRSLEPQQRRIDRIFKGANSMAGNSSSFRFGMNILRFERGSAYAQNKVAKVERDEVEKKYLLDTFSVEKKVKMFFGLFGDETIISTNLLFASDEQWHPQDFIALTMSREIRMKDVTQSDYRKIQEHVRRLIPASEYAKIDWKKWDFSEGKRVNGYFKNQLFFHPEALAAMPDLDVKSAYKLFRAYIERTGQPSANPYHSSPFPDERTMNRNWVDNYEMDMQYIAAYLSVVFSAGYQPQERYEKFKILKDYPLWQERGAGFMLSLIPEAKRPLVVSYEMNFSAKGVEEISTRFGSFKEEELYKSLMYIQSVINNRSFDLRLFTDEHGEFSLR